MKKDSEIFAGSLKILDEIPKRDKKVRAGQSGVILDSIEAIQEQNHIDRGYIPRKFETRLIEFSPYANRVISSLNTEDDDFLELVDSIEHNSGLLEPLVITPIPSDKNRFWVVSGHRRFAAILHLGLLQVDCVVRYYQDEQAVALAIHQANIKRKDPTDFEMAKTLSLWLEKGWVESVTKAADIAEISRVKAQRIIKILELPDFIFAAIPNPNEITYSLASKFFTALEEHSAIVQRVCDEFSQSRTHKAKELIKSIEDAILLESNEMKDGLLLPRPVLLNAVEVGQVQGKKTARGYELKINVDLTDPELVKKIFSVLQKID